MNKAGDYGSRLIWYKINSETDSNNGDVIDTYAQNGFLWANVEETNGRRQDDAGATQTGVDVEIRIRNYPSVSATDILRDEFLEYVYHIDSIRNGDDELICDCYRDDTLVNYTLED